MVFGGCGSGQYGKYNRSFCLEMERVSTVWILNTWIVGVISVGIIPNRVPFPM